MRAEPCGEAARFAIHRPVQSIQPAVLTINGNPTPLPAPAAVAPLVPLLLNLSADDPNLLLKHQDLSSELVPWKSADQLHTFLDKNSVNIFASSSNPGKCYLAVLLAS